MKSERLCGEAYLRGTCTSVPEVEASSDEVPGSGRVLLVWEKQPDSS